MVIVRINAIEGSGIVVALRSVIIGVLLGINVLLCGGSFSSIILASLFGTSGFAVLLTFLETLRFFSTVEKANAFISSITDDHKKV
jgi:hypothetical protein